LGGFFLVCPAWAGSRTNKVENEYGIGLNDNQQLEQFSELCQELGETEHVVSIAWTLSNPVVSSAIVGVRTLSHLDDLKKAATLKLDVETMERLNKTFNINYGGPLQSGTAPEAYSW
jgi:aryl-alcohol dehydrogenase-like predicted oxidoreductase